MISAASLKDLTSPAASWNSNTLNLNPHRAGGAPVISAASLKDLNEPGGLLEL